ncbi:phospholipase DDHD2 isoform X2 [Fopius arisanus]|uniref:Phospholipase DDHD2 isoform X2 n=2 Tax=Fopius arisanus TaxID=64838 RepID=A0A9R1SU02_9HYME|nr:PREDICTED: phospholipase DDHD2 isoform X2 [Fopius arisanus]
MGDQSRKMKNPLLTAAGQGFSFDDFGGSNLLMPVTPAVVNEPPRQEIHDTHHEVELVSSTPAILQPSIVEHNIHPPITEIPLTPRESKEPSVDSQRSYFTSILSSLPSLSLTSLTGQQGTTPSAPSNDSIEDRLSANNPSYFQPQEYHQPENPNDQSRPPSLQQPPHPPTPSCPPTALGTVSYRLGNQRRLKYAPPPDLTSSTVKTFTPPPLAVQSTPTQAQQSDFFNPSFAAPRADDNHGFPLVPLLPNNPSISAISGPQEIPTGGALRDPVTPHNTPANYFAAAVFEPNYHPHQQQSINDLSEFPPITGTSREARNDPTPSAPNDAPRPESVPEDLADIDLQRTSPPGAFQPREATRVSRLEGQSPIKPLIGDFPPVESANHLFTSNFPHVNSEPSLSKFFDANNGGARHVKPSQSAQPLSQLSFYNPVEFELNSSVDNLPRQCETTTQSAISGGFISATTNSGNWSSPRATSITSEMPEPTGTATLNPIQTSINPSIVRSQQTDTIPPSLHSLAAGSDKKMVYRPVYHHWFYRKNVENKVLWNPFSMQDSLSLEGVHNSSDITPETMVATDGGRYDVEILKRQRVPVYWTGEPVEVRRASWFYKGPGESRYIPYEEGTAARLEEEYKQACTNDHWNRKVELNNGEYVVFHSATIQIHYLPTSSPELVASWGNSAGTSTRPKVVKRGVDEFHIEEGEPEKIDHLLFLVHGIGSVCDLKFRSVEEVVDEFRSISLQLIQSHYRTTSTHGIVNRIEVLPISWHATLHSEDTGIDKKLKAITLESIPKLRHFTNDTLLDILFYTSPVFCQTIMQTVGNEMNRVNALFRERNPNFTGDIYLGGHSLGSLILFDLLCHQKAPVDETKPDADDVIKEEDENTDEERDSSINSSLKPMPKPMLKRRLSRKISYVMGAAGTGQPFIVYPHLNFSPKAFFALGSPIGMFVTVRGIDKLGENFKLPTCPAFFNIFHPFDPVAYRMEALINPEAYKFRPMLIPHHKGRKRMHLELKETMARVGADLKQKLLDSVKSTWNSVYQLAMFHRQDNHALEQEIDKVVEEQLQKSSNSNHNIDHEQDDDRENERGVNLKVGQLNGGRRIDYVLQEAPFEYINEYIFALTAHVCYWESEDTMLLILKEMYGANGIQTDAQLPQQTMTIERPAADSPSFFSPGPSGGVSTPDAFGLPSTTMGAPMGVDPTAPMSHRPVGPPPTSGFVRKS